MFPHEFNAVMNCRRVPTRWKRIFALSVYLYTRAGELEALDWASVKFDQRYVDIHQAIDADTGDVKTTKTKDKRKVPIEPTLLPLLTAMHKEANGKGRVVPAMPPPEDLAERLRKYVAWALQDADMPEREELTANDETRRPLSFHDLRHTGITWRAVRGDDPLKIMRAAGHEDLRTTQIYINEAQTFDEGFGEVFPPLPPAAIGGSGGIQTLAPTLGLSDSEIARSSQKQAQTLRPQGEATRYEPKSFVLQLKLLEGMGRYRARRKLSA